VKIKGAENVIGVLSGKGGVGKSTTTVLLAHALKDAGYKVGIIDADISDSSIPLLLGQSDDDMYTYCMSIDSDAVPAVINDVHVVSMGILNDDESVPIIWEPEQIEIFTKHILENNIWDVDYLLIDFPPGSGTVNQTIIQNLEDIRYLFVTQAHEVDRLGVLKSINLVKHFDGNIIGIVENRVDGKGGLVMKKLTYETDVNVVGEIPELSLDGDVIDYDALFMKFPAFMNSVVLAVMD
jgi:Mrp family chromosome partitioning ATPase